MGRRAVKPILMFKDMYVVNSHQERGIPTSGIMAWYNSENVTISNIDDVDTINDLSPNGFDLTFVNNKAKIVGAAWNGYPVIRFTRATNALYRTIIFPFNKAQPNTVFVVWKKNLSLYGAIFEGQQADSGFRHLIRHDSSTMRAFAGASLDYTKTAPFSILSTVIFNGLSSSIFENGILQSSGDAGADALRQITVGGLFNQDVQYAFDGDLVEIIVYDVILSASNQSFVEGYLKNKYAL